MEGRSVKLHCFAIVRKSVTADCKAIAQEKSDKVTFQKEKGFFQVNSSIMTVLSFAVVRLHEQKTGVLENVGEAK